MCHDSGGHFLVRKPRRDGELPALVKLQSIHIGSFAKLICLSCYSNCMLLQSLHRSRCHAVRVDSMVDSGSKLSMCGSALGMIERKNP